MKFHYLALYVVTALFLAFSSSPANKFLSFLYFFHPSTLLTFFHFLRSSFVTFCVIHFYLGPLSTFPTTPLTVSNTNLLIFFRCTFIFPISHPIQTCYFLQKFSALCRTAYKFSTFHPGFLYWNFMIFFNLMHIFASNKLLSQ